MVVQISEFPKKQLERCGTYLVTAAVACLFLLCYVEPAFAQGYDGAKFGQICNNVLSYVEGAFGSLLAVVAGLGAIVAAAAGGFRMAWACLVVSVGCFILRNYLDVFFEGLCQ